jgi:hypothetical protein
MLQAPYSKVEVCSVFQAACCPTKRPFVVHRPFNAFNLNPVAPQNNVSRCQRLVAQGFFDNVFKRGRSHAPELVRLNTDDEGGLAQTSADLFGPLVSQQSDHASVITPILARPLSIPIINVECRQSCWSVFMSMRYRHFEASCLTWMQIWSR